MSLKLTKNKLTTGDRIDLTFVVLVLDLWNESIRDHSGVSGELADFGLILSSTDSPL